MGSYPRNYFDWAEPVAEEQIERNLAIWTLNAHSYTVDNKSRAALFPTLSKAIHQCAPNAFYSSSYIEGYGAVIAHQDIAQGDLISIQYHFRSTTEPRRKRLALNYLFQCD